MRIVRWSPVLACALFACMDIDDLKSESYRRETPPPPPPTTSDDRPPTTNEEDTCTAFAIQYGPVTLPYAVKGRPYSAFISEHADDDWWGVSYDWDHVALPDGLVLEGDERYVESLRIHGVPTETGRFRISVSAVHERIPDGCFIQPDPHAFELDVSETDLDAGVGGQ
jgi:hypothetical protein